MDSLVMKDSITPLQTEAYQAFQRTQALVKYQRKLFLDLGATLKEVKDKKLYRQMGNGGFDSFRSFLASPEISLQDGIANKYIKVYEFYVEKIALPEAEIIEIPFIRLDMMKAKLEELPEIERSELIEKAKVLSYADFEEELYENKPRKKKIHIYKCKKCEKLVVEYDQDEICMCLGTANIITKPISY